MRALYTLIMYLGIPVILYRLTMRGFRYRGYLERWRERFGFFPAPQLHDAIWVHAVSVGEVNAAVPLVEALMQRYPERSLVVTTITPTGSDRVRRVFGDRVFHVYLPYDLPASVRRYLNRIRPSLAVVMETEIWPNLFVECRRRAIPIVVANARLSERSLRGYRPVWSLARLAIRSASFVAAQSKQDAERLLKLGADPERLEVVGNVKFDMKVPEQIAVRANAMRAGFGAHRPVWIAASTHEGEELPALSAHARVLSRFPDALLVIAPRHPERFRPVVQACRAYGFATRVRSEDGTPAAGSQCFVVDSLGELLDFYALSDVAFVAGSLDSIGGHNVLEAAALGVPVLVGPHTFNFAEITESLLLEGAALRIADGEALGPALVRLLADPDARRAMGIAARRLFERECGAVARIMRVVEAVQTKAVAAL